jgi:hypothetical protein
MATENEKYYEMAIAWGENYISSREEPKPYKIKLGETINDDIHFVSVQVERIKHSKGVELHQSYRRLREFKHFYEKIKANNLFDKLI